MSDYIFDPKTGKATHYKSDFRTGLTAELLRNKRFGKNHMINLAAATIDPESHRI